MPCRCTARMYFGVNHWGFQQLCARSMGYLRKGLEEPPWLPHLPAATGCAACIAGDDSPEKASSARLGRQCVTQAGGARREEAFHRSHPKKHRVR